MTHALLNNRYIQVDSNNGHLFAPANARHVDAKLPKLMLAFHPNEQPPSGREKQPEMTIGDIDDCLRTGANDDARPLATVQSRLVRRVVCEAASASNYVATTAVHGADRASRIRSRPAPPRASREQLENRELGKLDAARRRGSR